VRRLLPMLAVTTTFVLTSCNDSLFDTRSCTFVSAAQSDKKCDVDDVYGTVLGKTQGSSGGNPSVRVDTRDGEVRVFMKPKFWATYDVGENYP
jgi:hypothetical protein